MLSIIQICHNTATFWTNIELTSLECLYCTRAAGENPVYKVSPETGSSPMRTLHPNLLLQVNDIPVEPPVTNAHSKSQRGDGKSTKPTR